MTSIRYLFFSILVAFLLLYTLVTIKDPYSSIEGITIILLLSFNGIYIILSIWKNIFPKHIELLDLVEDGIEEDIEEDDDFDFGLIGGHVEVQKKELEDYLEEIEEDKRKRAEELKELMSRQDDNDTYNSLVIDDDDDREATFDLAHIKF